MPCDVSLTPKNLDFSQLIICGWLELDMPSLDVTGSKCIATGSKCIACPSGLGRRCQKIETISRFRPMRPVQFRKKNRFLGILGTDVSRKGGGQ